MRNLCSSILIFFILQVSPQIEDGILYIDDFETFFVTNTENFSEENFNNQETEFTFDDEEEEEEGTFVSSSSIVANSNDCLAVVVEYYEEFLEEEEISEMMFEEYTEALATVAVLDCQSIRRCQSYFIPRIGWNCLCKEEISCFPLY